MGRPVTRPKLMVVSGWTAAGKSTIAGAIVEETGATVASFDWLMSALRSEPAVWRSVEAPSERQRSMGRTLLARVAEQQLRVERSCVLDLVADQAYIDDMSGLAHRYGAAFFVIECICSDVGLHRQRTEGRRREIPGWYELSWPEVLKVRERYVALDGRKLVIDTVQPISTSLGQLRDFLHLG